MLEVTELNFNETVKSSVPTLVDFWAPWCAPCRAITPVLERLSKEYEGRCKIVKINIDENQNIASRFNVMSIPTLMMFKDGKAGETKIGGIPEDWIRELIEGSL